MRKIMTNHQTDRRDYAIEQLKLGNAFDDEGNTAQAREHWGNIKREDDAEIYLKAQIKLGYGFDKEGNTAQSREHWGNRQREDNAKVYASAQFVLGCDFVDEDNTAQAREHWGNIKREDNPKIYANAQFNLGVTFNDEGNTAQVHKHWSNIKREDDAKTYAKAQFHLGYFFKREGNTAQAFEHWSNIKREDSPQQYAKAQLNLGFNFHIKDDTAQSREHWCNIKQEDDIEVYASDNFCLGISYLSLADLANSLSFFKNVHSSSPQYYSAKMYQRILEVGDSNISNSLLKIREIVESILRELVVERHLDDSKVAHYTTAGTAHLMLSRQMNNEEGKSYSPLRLTTIQNVNDPTEGKLLLEHLKISNGNSFTDTGRFQAFIACFSFNHDWLNQFRLYGKSDHLEASGVSLVFNHQFFSGEHDIGAHIKTTNNATNIGLESKEIPR